VGDPFVPKKPAKEVGVIDRYWDLKVAFMVFIFYGTFLHMGTVSRGT
jgi:hypothetical protein